MIAKVELSLKREAFISKLFLWFKTNKRDFPWRRTKDPYQILIAEIMLQKTTSKQVDRLFKKFICRFPSLKALANSSVKEVKELIISLGMENKKAEWLVGIAQNVSNKLNGEIPLRRKDLLELPGVGDYVANAVLILTLNANLPLLDVNIARVLGRIFNIKSKKHRARTDKKLWKQIGEMIPDGKAKQFNLGIIDFGALICQSRKPKCNICPMSSLCNYCSNIQRS